jgi:hypothetical protein
MADWYASSVAHAAVPQWAATTAYTVGQFVRALAAPAVTAQYVHRCTTAGTTAGTEPTWGAGNNQTTSSGTATFTNVTGQSTYGWSAAGGNLYSFTTAGVGRLALGDRIFVSSDHAETTSVTSYNFFGSNGWGGVSVVSVNRAGSVPPVAADVLAGATLTLTATGTFTFEGFTPNFFQGLTFNIAASTLNFNSSGLKSFHFKDCALVMTNAAATRITSANPTDITWENTTYRVTHSGSLISNGTYNFDFTWLNTPSAIQGGTVPASLVNANGAAGARYTFRGVDLSAITGTLLGTPVTSAAVKMLLDSCRIASGVTRIFTFTTAHSVGDSVELVNCYDGTNIVNERHRSAGAVTTERTTTMSGGATDGTGAFSFKLVSSSRADRYVDALDTFYLDRENLLTGSARTATVEIISSGTLNVDDVFLSLEYLGTSGSTLASFKSSKPSAVSAAALPTSSVTWNSPPGTPVKQYLQVTFTPLTAGRVRGRVHLGKPSTTIWINPQIAIA